MSQAYTVRLLWKIARSIAIAGISIAALLSAAAKISAADATSQKAATSVGKDEPESKVGARDIKKRSQPSDEKKLARSATLVQDALFNEIAGDKENRDRLLKDAQELNADFPPAQWHDGKVMVDGEWLTVDDALKVAAKDPRLAEYLRRRAKTPDTEQGNIQLADWCLSRKLDSQARAHYERALSFNPDNLTARARLGYQKIKSQWVSPDEYEQRVAQQANRAQALSVWLPRLIGLRNALFSDKEAARAAAAAELASIKDLEAVPALERAFSTRSVDANIVLVDKLSEISGEESSYALARQAIFSRSAEVRTYAATKLNGRPLAEFAPQMLIALKSKIHMGVGLTNFGRPEIWQTFSQEDQYSGKMIKRGTAYYLNAKPAEIAPGTVQGKPLPFKKGGDKYAAEQMNKNMNEQLGKDGAAVWSANQSINAVNDRVIAALQLATGHPEIEDVNDWWTWWDSETEMQSSGAKPYRSISMEREVSIFDTNPYEPDFGFSTYQVTISDWHLPVYRASCFVAGTPVTTVAGAQSIETIKVGDLVLSQSADTGELCFKPVMRTTIRPPVSIFTVETSGTTLHATGGHLFWVAGEGWTKARNLRSGQTLHCANGTVQVSLVTEEQQPQQSYNLVVADFNTYFVGAERILSHDVTERKPTRSIVPGLARN